MSKVRSVKLTAVLAMLAFGLTHIAYCAEAGDPRGFRVAGDSPALDSHRVLSKGCRDSTESHSGGLIKPNHGSSSSPIPVPQISFAPAPQRHSPSSNMSVDVLLAEANTHTSNGLSRNDLQEFRKAVELLEQAHKLQPDRFTVLEKLTWLYLYKVREFGNGYRSAVAMARIAPDDMSTKKLLAYASSQTGRHRKAIPLYREVLDADPVFDAWMASNLAETYLNIGEVGSALEQYAQILKEQPDNAAAEQSLDKYLGPNFHDSPHRDEYVGVLTEAMRQIANARHPDDYYVAAEALERAAAMNPENHFVLKTLGWIYAEHLGRPSRAYILLCRARKLSPRDLETKKLLALALYGKAEFSAAILLFRSILTEDPTDTAIRVSLGRALSRQKCYSGAMTQFQDVLSEKSNCPTARLGVAEVLAWRGETARPQSLIQTVLADDPKLVDGHVLSGDLHRWNWQLEAARGDYLTALELNPNNRSAESGLAEVDRRQSWKTGFDFYSFIDVLDFSRTAFTESIQAPVRDGLYVGGRLVQWQFEQGVFIEEDRDEQHLDLEWHPKRGLEFDTDIWSYDYDRHDSEQAAATSLEWRPFPEAAFFAVGSVNEPAYMDSINIALDNIRMDQLGVGMDVPLSRRWTSQASYTQSWYSDENRRRYTSIQTTLELDKNIYRDLRLKYELLSYEHREPAYFSPPHYHVIRLGLDLEHKLTEAFRLEGTAELPYVIEETGRLGYVFKAGAAYRLKLFEAKASYTKLSMPGAQQFSGDVFVVEIDKYW